MKSMVKLGLSGVLLIAGAGLSAAQPPVEKRGAAEAAAEKPSTKQVCGLVTQVDDKAKRFTISAKGKAVTFDAAQVKTLPKVGETVVVTYLATGDSKGARGHTIGVNWETATPPGKK